MPIAAGASPTALDQLIQRSKELGGPVDLHLLVNGIGKGLIKKAVEESDGKIKISALFLGPNLREAYANRQVRYIPGNLADFSRFVVDPDKPEFKYSAMIVRVAPPDAEGRYSLGPNHDHIMTILEWAPHIKVIAEVNPNIPRTRGSNFLTRNQITRLFESQDVLAGPAKLPLTEVELRIGEHLANLVKEGATIQVGIGNIFDGLAPALQAKGQKELHIRTEMFSDSLMDVMNLGIVGSAITGFAYGTPDLYKWLDGNQALEFHSTDFVNNPGFISQIYRMTAINTALQVNLYGEVNATMGPSGRISSPGGQVEFMQGASKSVDGKSIVAIRSTAKNGELSTIVLDFYRGPITTPHEVVSHVVTEYGIATLRGKNEAERAKALIRVAHPNFRKALAEEAFERNLISAEERDEF